MLCQRSVGIGILLLLHMACGGQTSSIVVKGTVARSLEKQSIKHVERLVDPETPLDQAVVTLENSFHEVVSVRTDSNGYFELSISQLTSGEHDFLEVGMAGYSGFEFRGVGPDSKLLLLKPGNNLLVIELAPSLCPLPDKQDE